MGSEALVEGEIRIDPPLRWAEYRDLPIWEHTRAQKDGTGHSGFCVYLEETSEDVETDDGVLNRRIVAEIRPWGGFMKTRDLVANVQTVLDAFPDRTFTGCLLVAGEDFGDIWRVVVEHEGELGKFVAADQCPKITWPDGTETEPHHVANMQSLRYNSRSPF